MAAGTEMDGIVAGEADMEDMEDTEVDGAAVMEVR